MDVDRQLLDQYTLAGSREALDLLVRRHVDLVFSAALRQVRDRHLAEDVTQAVFLILSKKARSIRAGAAVGGWLLAVTRRTAVDAMRKEIVDRRHDEAAARPEREEAGVAAEVQWGEIAPVLDAALDRLPVRDRDALVLRVLEKKSMGEVGAVLGVSEFAAGKRVGRALARLRKILQGHGITAGVAALTTTLATRAVHAAPAHLLSATLATTTAGTASASITALVKNALSTMTWATTKLAAVLALALSLPFAAGAIMLIRAPNPTPPTVSRVAKQTIFVANPIFFEEEDRFIGPNVARDRGTGAVLMVDDAPRSAMCLQMAADAAGNIYAVGYDLDSTKAARGLVREKRSGQAAWTTIFETPGSQIQCLAVSLKGDLYVGVNGWDVYQRPAGQAKFLDLPIDDQLVRTGATYGLATDSQANVYAVGMIDGHWIVRKQTHGTGAFATVDDLALMDSAGKPLFAYASRVMVVEGQGRSRGVYVVGYCPESIEPMGPEKDAPVSFQRVHWLVRKSVDDGLTWIPADSYVGAAGAFPSTVWADAAGTVYVSGSEGGHWITRRSATGELHSWTMDNNVGVPDASASGAAAATDAAGNVYLLGTVRPNGKDGPSVIRTNATGTWQTLGDYQMPSSDGNFNTLAVGPDGRIYVGGYASGQAHNEADAWIVRSAPAPAPSRISLSTQPQAR